MSRIISAAGDLEPALPGPGLGPPGFVALFATAMTLLSELQSLLEQGLVTQDEYAARRHALIDGV